MARIIAFRPRRRAHHIGTALSGVIADSAALEQTMARLWLAATAFAIALGVVLQVLG